MQESEGMVQCSHHWIIEPPAGPFSKGTCQLCGESREFDNLGDVDLSEMLSPSRPSHSELPR